MQYDKSVLERLQELNDEFEIWWDASPLVFSTWREEYLEDIPAEKKEKFKEYVNRLYNEDNPADSVFRGVTTNPRITRETLDWIPEEWKPWIKELKEGYQGASLDELAWKTYSKITEEGVKKYIPMFEASGYKFGHVSAQVDPRLVTDTREMLKQGIGLKSLSPNIMIKSPATKEGVYNIMLLTALGIPTNATVCFTLPQIMAVAKAVKKGKEIGENNGVDYSQWRSVITLMLGRLEEAEPFLKQAEELGIEMTQEVQHWVGLAVAKKAVRILEQEQFPSKLLLCSSRPGPVVDGKQKVWHVEKMAGEPVVYTINPSMIGDLLKFYEDEPVEDCSKEEIPAEILSQLIKIPYFRQAYSAYGMSADEFIDHPATVYTANGFAGDMELLKQFIEKV